MKEIITKLNKQFESRVRLGIMAVLMVNETLSFNSLKELLNVTDGNLASHLNALEKSGMIQVHKQFIGRKPNTQYKATENGRKAFQEHLDYLDRLINSREKLTMKNEK
jgi:DNA-binding HxlR family transcriptional regulator